VKRDTHHHFEAPSLLRTIKGVVTAHGTTSHETLMMPACNGDSCAKAFSNKSSWFATHPGHWSTT